MALGAGLSLLFFAVELGVRVDIGPALETWRFDLKIVTVLLALVLATGLCLDCLRPDASPHPLRRLLPLLAVGTAVTSEAAAIYARVDTGQLGVKHLYSGIVERVPQVGELLGRFGLDASTIEAQFSSAAVDASKFVASRAVAL